MSDLISRSALIEEIKGFTDISEEYFKNPKLLIEIIENTKTAYDVEKVVEQMRSESQLMSEAQLPHRYYKAIGTKRARTIIRKGGVNERD